jgi:HSP20 family protein
MALVQWEPARELSSLQTEMNRLFGSFFEPAAPGTPGSRRWLPAMDLVEQDDAFVLHADLPGMADEDVHVEVDGDVLTISGERKAEHEAKKDGYVRVERSFGTFRRSLTLPDGVDPEQVAAKFERGVLEVRIPKPAERRPRKVAVAVGDSTPAIEGEASKPAQS